MDPPQARTTAYAHCVGVGCMPEDRRLVEANGTVRTRDDLSGNVVLLVAWASWCTPCIDVIAALTRIQQRSAGRDLVVLGMSVEALDAMQMDGRVRDAEQPPEDVRPRSSSRSSAARAPSALPGARP